MRTRRAPFLLWTVGAVALTFFVATVGSGIAAQSHAKRQHKGAVSAKKAAKSSSAKKTVAMVVRSAPRTSSTTTSTKVASPRPAVAARPGRSPVAARGVARVRRPVVVSKTCAGDSCGGCHTGARVGCVPVCPQVAGPPIRRHTSHPDFGVIVRPCAIAEPVSTTTTTITPTSSTSELPFTGDNVLAVIALGLALAGGGFVTRQLVRNHS